ncbi:ABC transporter substrate-binding protein [Paenibacillus nasutitermitis]|nr:sugar ABC transporter substrate-binding protein [Paenibacillus nasutitermitis]
MKSMFMVLLTAILGMMTVLSGCNASQEQTPTVEPLPVIELRVAGYKSGSEIGAIPELNERFMKENPNIKVIYDGMPGVQFSKQLRNQFAMNEAPDVIMLHPGLDEVGGYSKAGFIRDLSDEPWISKFTPWAIEGVSIDGKVYGTPNEMVVLGVYYNKELFKKHSLRIPTNWDEFVEVCAKLKSSGLTPISIGNNDGWMTLAALYAMGASLIKDPDFDKKLNARQIKFNGTWNEMVQMWYDLEDKGYLTPNSTEVSMDQAQKYFMDGKAGMLINGSWALPGLMKSNPDLELGMFALPANPPGERTVVTAAVGTTWTISSKTKQLEAARKYLAFWSTGQTLRQWAISQASFLTLNNVESGALAELHEISRSLETGSTREFLSNRWETSGFYVTEEMMESAQGVYLKALTIEQMLTNMDNTWDNYNQQEGNSSADDNGY